MSLVTIGNGFGRLEIAGVLAKPKRSSTLDDYYSAIYVRCSSCLALSCPQVCIEGMFDSHMPKISVLCTSSHAS